MLLPQYGRWDGTALKCEPLLTMNRMSMKRKREGTDADGAPPAKKELKASASGGGGVGEAGDDLEVTGSKTAAEKAAALRADAVDIS
jgi:hypothetical protein